MKASLVDMIAPENHKSKHVSRDSLLIFSSFFYLQVCDAKEKKIMTISFYQDYTRLVIVFKKRGTTLIRASLVDLTTYWRTRKLSCLGGILMQFL